MTIEVALVISVVSVSCSVITLLLNSRRNSKADDSNEASKMTTVIVKLENIGTGIAELKSEINNLKDDLKEYREKQIITDQSVKQAWHQIDELKVTVTRLEAMINELMTKLAALVKGSDKN